jgi:cytosine/adenosine deaminase-related metal-dependent hydrolase
MATIVTVINNAATNVTLKPANKTSASVTVAPSSNISLGSLTNVDIADVADGETLIYNSANGKFEGGTVTSTVTNIFGGSF